MTVQLTRSAPECTEATGPPTLPRWAGPLAAALIAGLTLLAVGVFSADEIDPSTTSVAPGSRPAPPDRPDRPAVVPQSPAHVIIQGEIDRALAERVGSAVPPAIADSPPASVPDVASDLRAYLIIQSEIDRALGDSPISVPDAASDLPAYLIIQAEIDRALAERAQAPEGGR